MRVSEAEATPLTDTSLQGQMVALSTEQGAAEAPASLAEFLVGSLTLQNASMFRGYYPELTRRLHITPILYACYLAAWRYAALAGKALVSTSLFSWTLFCRWNRVTLCWVRESVMLCAVALLHKSGRLERGSGQLKSFPLAPGGKMQCSLSMRRQGLGRRMSQVAAVAAKVVGLPLMHCLLNGKFTRTQSGTERYSVAPAASQPGPSSRPPLGPSGRRDRVRPVVVDGVVVGHCLPKQQKQQPRYQARTLLQVMFGLQAKDDAGKKDAQPPFPARPLSRRIM